MDKQKKTYDNVEKIESPSPLFDSMENVISLESSNQLKIANSDDYFYAKEFLKSYKGSSGTFNAYRREIERLLQWSWLIAKKSIRELNRNNIEEYISFCKAPPHMWIGIKKSPRFLERNGIRLPNKEWRPFVVTISKSAFHAGKKVNINHYELSSSALKDMFAILSSFYNFLIQEEYTEVNPILNLRQKSKYIRKYQGKQKIRRLSELQWNYVIETAELMAEKNSKEHRTLFIVTALYAMYLRISELTASERWIPKMSDFYCDHDGLWWFTTVGKDNKERQISVSDAMLEALKKYRKSMQLTPLPSPSDKTPLLPKTKGKGAISNTTYIRRIVQRCFDKAIIRLQKDGFNEEADSLLEATVHWLRHTGISDDVKIRPREHVRDDAGHSSSAITDKYIDIELRERHLSERKKTIKK